MQMSQQINELAAALSRLQAEITDPHKDKKAFNYMYSDLGSALEIGRPLLAKHGLAVLQAVEGVIPENRETTDISVCTLLMHSSGQWVLTDLNFPVAQSKGMTLAQSAGSVITYLRRYSYKALLCMSDADNDAADAPANSPAKATNPPSQIHDKLQDLVVALKVDSAETATWLERGGVTMLRDLKEAQAAKLVAMLMQRQQAAATQGVKSDAT